MAMIKKLASMCRPESLAAHLTLAFGLTVLAAMLGIVFYVNHQAIGIVQDASRTLFDHIATESRNQIDNNVSKVDGLLSLYATNPQANDFASASRHAFIRRMSLSLQASPMVSALYVGYEDGSFVLLRRLTSPVAREQLKAPDAASYYLETVRAGTGAAAAGTATMALTFLDDALQPVGAALAPADPPYDPRTRNWYRMGIGSENAVITNPYWFFLTQERGITMARRLASGHGVVGVDLGLADLSQALRQMKSTKSSILMIVNAQNEVVASSVPIGPDTPNAGSPWPASSMATHLLRVASDSDGGQATTRTVNNSNVTWVMRTVPLHSGPWTFRMAVATPDNEMLAGARRLTSTLLWLGVAMALAAMAVVQVVARAVSRPLTQLAQDAERIQRFQFEPGFAQVDSSVREIRTLSQSMRQAGLTIQRFTEVGQALSAERDPTKLMVRLLREAVNIAEAEGGLLLMSEDEGEKLSVIDRDTSAEDAEPRTVDRLDVDAQVLAAIQGKTVAHFDHARTPLPPFLAGLVEATPLPADQVFRFSVVPLLNRAGDVVGGLLLAARGKAGMQASDASLDLIQVLSATAAMTIEMTLLLKARKSLLDAVVRMIANSIDAKSPYTGGHCQRVPMLAMSLVRAASRSRSGPFADFTLTPDDWEAVKVASWLHDCGKLTTPEYIVDKATKLESLYNRLHEIRMRFELLKSGAWVAYWRGVAAGAQPQAHSRRRWPPSATRSWPRWMPILHSWPVAMKAAKRWPPRISSACTP
ncbi:GAF domain-containing protein [Bordetella sp. FB-8]|uniref:GAF domain-containing protein n=1 Tax=Bordetella sp. FB-8 TaxID=1159870 RepID=UPI0003A4DF3E|nr:GAF domain-containing protein [Bordetella sp. FB-8]